MSDLSTLNLADWIAANRETLKPPVGNKMLWNSNFMVMVVAGPNQRKDYHVNPGEELFFQIEGDIVVRIRENGKPRDIPVKQGELFLLPSNVPHSPQRPAGRSGWCWSISAARTSTTTCVGSATSAAPWSMTRSSSSPTSARR